MVAATAIQERGLIPNSHQIPNLYSDRYMAFLTSEEWKVLTYTARRIFGFNKRSDRISLSQYTSGTKSIKGEHLDYGTGLSLAAVRRAIKGLIKFGLIIAGENGQNNDGTLYSLELDEQKIKLEALQERHEKQTKANTQKSEKARQAATVKRKGSLSDRPPLSHSTPNVPQTPTPYVGQTPGGTVAQKHNIQGNPEETQRIHFGETAFRGSPDTPPKSESEPVKAKRYIVINPDNPENIYYSNDDLLKAKEYRIVNAYERAYRLVIIDTTIGEHVNPELEEPVTRETPAIQVPLIPESQPEQTSSIDSPVLNVKEIVPPARVLPPVPHDPPLPEIPSDYKTAWTHEARRLGGSIGSQYTRHYIPEKGRTTLCHKTSFEYHPSNWTYPGYHYPDEQCPACAAKLAERQAKATARAEKAKEKAEPEYVQPSKELKNLWARILYGGENGMLGKHWKALVKLWNELKCPDADATKKFGKYWYQCDWRGKQGQRPTYGQVTELWPASQNWNGSNCPQVTDLEPDKPKERVYEIGVDFLPPEMYEQLKREGKL